nr:hypothetical protein [uncultured Dysosmobacter sp.]
MIDRRKVYIYRTTGEPKFSGLAMDCQIHQTPDGRNQLWFDETGHGHMITGEIIKETPEGFTFRSDGYEPGAWTFQVLTIEDFRRWVYKHVTGGETIAAKIRTTADLHEWYRRAFDIP